MAAENYRVTYNQFPSRFFTYRRIHEEDIFQKGNETFLKSLTWNFVLNSQGILVWGVLSRGLFSRGLCLDTHTHRYICIHIYIYAIKVKPQY